MSDDQSYPDRAVLAVRDGTDAVVTFEAVAAAVAARGAPGTRQGPGTEVIADGRRAPAVQAVADAAGLAESNVPLSDAVRVLRLLGFEVAPGAGPAPDSRSRPPGPSALQAVGPAARSAGRSGPHAGAVPAGAAAPGEEAASGERSVGLPLPGPMQEPPPTARTVLTEEAWRALRRHRGRWVALRDGRVAGTGASAREAMKVAAASASTPVTVMFVPSSPPGPDR